MQIRQQTIGPTAARWAWATVDGVAWILCTFLATWLRYDFSIPQTAWAPMLVVAASASALHLLVGAVAGPYAFGHDRGSFEEVVELGRAVAIATTVFFVAVAVVRPAGYPRAVPLTAGAMALGSMLALRFVLRAWRQRQAGARRVGRRVVVFGAGEGGRQLLRAMLRDPNSPYLPVALLDDDPRKNRLRLQGLKVQGTRAAIGRISTSVEAEILAIAVPSAASTLVRDLTALADEAGLDVLILPPVIEMFGATSTGDLRDVDLSDLLGRRPVSLDTTLIARQIAGRTILVTGAGGSIGSELCRQIMRFGPGKLYLLDRDESGLQSTQISLTGSGLLDTDDLVLADIRDIDAMRCVFGRTKPDMVFHAAALKHLPLLESHPLEAWKSNVVGTLNVLTAAAEVGVGTFVNISTDKAANATCVLGFSKRLAERLTADFASNQPGRYVSVRFGNVLGSRGSVIHTFTAQIERGGPITVTDPEVERFFMLIPEACQLVLEAAAIGADGEVMVLDMGEQVKIVDVATTLIRMSRRTDIDIIYTGLRPGEKLKEELFSPDETRQATTHSLVSSVEVPGLDATTIRDAVSVSDEAAAQRMRSESAHLASRASVSG